MLTTTNVKDRRKNSSFWFRYLLQTVLGVREFGGSPFEGLTANCSNNYINLNSVYFGYVFAFKNNAGEFFLAPAAKIYYNYMWQPKKMKITDPRITPVPITRTVNKDCVFVPLTADMLPLFDIIDTYAKRLERIEDGLRMNEFFSRTEGIFKVKDDPSAQKVRRILDDVEKGKLGVLVDNVFVDELLGNDGKGVRPLIEGVQYRGYEYATMLRETIREFNEFLGIEQNAANIMKKERSTADEATMNNEYSAIRSRAFSLETERAIKRVNEMFGTDISVTWKVKGEEYESLRDAELVLGADPLEEVRDGQRTE